MNYTPIASTTDLTGELTTVCGWVHSVRDMGKMAFIDLRDHTGLLQVVVASDELPRLGVEWVVAVTGEVKARGERFVNPKLTTGTVELKASKIEVINSAAELPIEIKKDTSAINEDTRLRYRYLDLRSERMQANLRLRHRVMQFVRNFLSNADFIEIETPMLTKGTPEGAREYLVPSRLHPGEFFVLPQSPQQFKQLLMVAGFGRYFQLAKAMRDEDQRGDRQPEFTQIDLELSFVDQEEILRINEAMMIELVEQLMPEHRITGIPFPRLTYAEAMEKYGSDKPDLRVDKSDDKELAFTWILDFPMFETGKDGIAAVHHPFTSPHPEDAAKLSSEPLSVRAQAYDLALNGFEMGSGSIRIADAKLQRQVFEILGMEEDEITTRFGHMLEAFRFGTPPHGGFAYGFDRLVMVLAGEPNIREVIAFPKTGDARDPLMGAPSPVAEDKLADVHITSIEE
ncbi:MAG: aspartate--tRNA ligase [Candidatus Saccharimonadales bacterium]